MAQKWEDWLDDLMPHLPGAEQPLIEHYLRSAARKFFTDSLAWQVPIEAISLEAGEASYEISFDADEGEAVKIVGSVLWATKTTRITGATRAQLRDLYGDYTLADPVAVPKYFTSDDAFSVLLIPPPAAALADAVTGMVAVRPVREATGLADEMALRYHDEIANGALSLLLSIPKKPWTDQALAGDKRAMFNVAIGQASANGASGQGSAPLRSRPQNR